MRRKSAVLQTRIKLDKIRVRGIEFYMRKDRRTGMAQLIGVFLQLFFAKALQMVQHLPIGGLTQAKQDGKAIPHFRELPMLMMQNKRFFQDISSRDRQAQLFGALQLDKLAQSQDGCAEH
jgi:hypothetical protein